MKITTRERAIRTIISSFLQSDLTAKEINEISNGFLYNSDFIKDIGNALYQISDIIYNNYSKKQGATEFEDEIIEKAQEIIKRKRLSKAKIVSAIKKINPDFSKTIEAKIKKMTVKNLLSQFLAISGLSDFIQFVNMLEGGQTGFADKYLEGILKNVSY